MTSFAHRASLGLVATMFAVTSFACSSSSASSADSAGSGEGTAPPSEETSIPGEADRAIAEADIVQLSAGKLYAMSRTGNLAIVDVSIPGRLTLLGKVRLAGEPFEMYRRGDLLIAMTNGAFAPDGSAVPVRENSGYQGRPQDAGAGVVMVDVNDPRRPKVVDAFPVPGEIADSRVVGDVLYLATYENGTCYRCSTTPHTLLSSFDLTDVRSLRRVDQLHFQGGPGNAGGTNSFTSTPWKRSIIVTEERLYIGGLADTLTPAYEGYGGYMSLEGVLEVVDVRDPKGRLVRGASIPIAGPVLSRWQVDERDGVLRVVSQRGAGSTRNGGGKPAMETFKIESAEKFVPLGYGEIKLPTQEGLRAVRFDGERAYAITYKNTDPLFVLDFKDPTKPKQRGEIHMPGFVFHMEPRGDKLLGLGIDSRDPNGNLNVSLFDVSDLDRPFMVQRVSFGPRNGTDGSLQSGALPEDQDRIQKAFRIIGDGNGTDLVVMPFSQPGNGSSDSCSGVAGGVQLVDWNTAKTTSPLTRRAMLPVRGHARRAIANGGELITVSESNVRTFSLSSRDEAVQTADLEVGKCTQNSYYGMDDDGMDNQAYACSFSPRRSSSSSTGGLFGLAVSLAMLGLARSRSRSRT